MKKLLIAIALAIGFAIPLCTKERTWSQRSPKEIEMEYINVQLATISEHFRRTGGLRSSAYHMAVFTFLRNHGTPTSFKVWEEFHASLYKSRR